jgi:CheY-like chemotaxis protein
MSSERQGPIEQPPERALNVLVADDSPINRRIAEASLRKLGHRCTTVANGREAVTAWTNRRFDVVLMDCQMPEMDGFEATVQIRKLEVSQGRTPIVAMTASEIHDDRELCRVAGMDGYVKKPVEPEVLATVLVKAVEGTLEPPTEGATPPDRSDRTIDGGRLDALRRLAVPDEADPFPEIIRAFLVNAATRLAEIRPDRPASSLRGDAHSLKGISGMVGATRLSNLCGTLEDVARGGLEDEALIESIHLEFHRVRKALEHELQRAAGPAV